MVGNVNVFETLNIGSRTRKQLSICYFRIHQLTIMADISKLKTTASQVRRDIVRMVHAVQSGHPGASLGCTEFFVCTLLSIVLNYQAAISRWKAREKIMFFLIKRSHLAGLVQCPGPCGILRSIGAGDLSERSTPGLQGHPATEEGLPGIRDGIRFTGAGIVRCHRCRPGEET